MGQAVRAVLFDFGGVLTSSPFEAFSAFEQRRGLPDGFLRRVNATNHHDNAWARLERGELTVDAFGDAFAEESAALGHPVDGREVLALLFGELRPAMVEALRRCASRLKTGLLTNNFVATETIGEAGAAEGASGFDVITEVVALFDVVVESSVVGVRKPDPRFYELACDLLDIAPHEAVFLDDLGVNLKPARAMGMATIKVTDPDAAIDELAAIVGFPLR